MLVTDLEYLETLDQLKYIQGAAYTYAKAKAHADASNEFASANSVAVAEGDYVTAKTGNSVTFISGRFINYSSAFATSFATARTGHRYSASVDFDADADVSLKY